MIMRIIALIIIIFFLGGCSSTKKNKNPEESSSLYNYRYEKYKDLLVPKRFFSHFPDRMYAPFFSQIVVDDMAKYYSYLFALYSCDIDILRVVEQDLLKSKYESYLATDSALLVVKDSDSYSKIKEHLIKGDVLVPFFNEKILSPGENVNLPDFYSSETPTGLSSNFRIFIIENKSIYNSTESEKKNLFREIPTAKNEAFSRGICLNLKSCYVIYWTMFF